MNPVLPDAPGAADSLGLAIVLASSTPLVLLDDKFVVRAASVTFCRMLGLDPEATIGSELYGLGAGEWDVPQLRSLLGATVTGSAAVEAYELDLVRGSDVRHLVLNAQRLTYADGADLRLLLAVTDVTEARLVAAHNADLLRDKQVLLQELQHRVANSLQIIASVLMQSARKVQSEEARVHLNNAHLRVLSIAKLQKQLAATAVENVALRPYFTDLCSTIGASMIADPDRIGIAATVDETTTPVGTSVSLGLIATELVINALKHAFPGRRSLGEIALDFSSDGAAWTLSVKDNGVGRPLEAAPGLGTGIVEALSKQLCARVEIQDAHPGTQVSIIHDEPVAR